MGLPLRVLIIEDSDDDAKLIVRELKSGGFDVKYQRVDSSAAVCRAFDSQEWDLIISDYSMPHFSGTDALKLVRSRHMEVPFIFVSGTIGEETAVAAMKNGAQDYLIKGNLTRLTPAVQRELRDLEQRKERERLQKHVQQLQKFEAIGRLSGGIAHDFNNMIGAILGWAELGYEEAGPGTKIRERFQKIRDQSYRAAKLTSQLLAFGRRQVLQPRKINLNLFIREEMSFLGKVIGENIEVKIVQEPDLQVIHADPTQLQQVFMNLCLNARDAMPAGGKLKIGTRNVEIGRGPYLEHEHARPGNYVLMTIGDTGVGMDKATAERIFEPFFTTKEMGKGTGLGLSTAYGIVKQHHGLIYVDSEPGKGSTFRVYFPAESGIHEPREVSGNGRALKGSETILLVEDDDGLRESVQEMLQSLGYRVISASDGNKAVAVFKAHAAEINLVVMDVVMPSQGGLKTYPELQGIKSGIQVIFTSGYSDEAESLAGLLEKGAMFLQKPYDLAKLSQMIRSTLDRSRTTQKPFHER
jgi:two-component system, cell cycle sensor histidine kinase and response regulator CckA